MKKHILSLLLVTMLGHLFAAEQPAKQFKLPADAKVYELNSRYYSTKIDNTEIYACKRNDRKFAKAYCVNVRPKDQDATEPLFTLIEANQEQLFLQMHGRYIEQEVNKLAKIKVII